MNYLLAAVAVLISCSQLDVNRSEQTVASLEAALRNVPERVPELVLESVHTSGMSTGGYYFRRGSPMTKGSPTAMMVQLELHSTAEDAGRLALLTISVAPTSSGTYKGLKIYRWGETTVKIVAGRVVLSMSASMESGGLLYMKVADGILADIGAIRE